MLVARRPASNNSFKPSPLRGLGHTGPQWAGRLNSGVRAHLMLSGDLRSLLTGAIRYWEPRRLIYNAALLGVVVVHFILQLPHSREVLSADLGLSLFILAVLANIAFSAAYLPDLIMQLSDYRSIWLKLRWLLLLIGTAFACAIANFFARAMFGNAP